jgi:hypothetical protein
LILYIQYLIWFSKSTNLLIWFIISGVATLDDGLEGWSIKPSSSLPNNLLYNESFNDWIDDLVFPCIFPLEPFGLSPGLGRKEWIVANIEEPISLISS